MRQNKFEQGAILPNWLRQAILFCCTSVTLAVLWLSFGAVGAVLGLLAMLARMLVRPDDWLRYHPMLRKARPANPLTAGPLIEMTTRFARQSGIAPPRLLLVPGVHPNGYVLGRAGDGVILLTEAVTRLPTQEQAALIGHEIGHLQGRHHDLKGASGALLIVTALALVRWSGHYELALGDEVSRAALGVGLGIVLLIGTLIHHRLAWLIEAEADHQAVHLTGCRDGVVAMVARHLALEQAQRHSGYYFTAPLHARMARLAKVAVSSPI